MASRSRVRNYSREELMNFLGIMLQIMPIGGDDWEAVLEEHSILFPGREVESLRRKFSLLHRKKIPTGDPRCPEEVILAKRIKYQISSRADVGDGEEEMDLATGTFTNTIPTEDGTFDGDIEEDEDNERLEDEVEGEFAAPSVPQADLRMLSHLAQRSAPRAPAQEDQNQDSEDDQGTEDQDAIPFLDAAARAPPALGASLAESISNRSAAAASLAVGVARAPPALAASLAGSVSNRSASEASLRASSRMRSASEAAARRAPPAAARTAPPAATASTPTSRGSNSARPLVSPFGGDRTRGSRNNPQQDGLMQMMQMSMLQHNQHMEEERLRRVDERESRLAMQQMFATAVGGAFAAINKYTKGKEKDDDSEEE